MNSLVIPPCPNWYKSDIMACAPDNTLIYGSGNKIVIINPKPAEQPADIKIIQNAHNDKVFAIAINPQWNKSNRWAASIGQDKIIKLWDMKKYELIHSNSVLISNESHFVGIHFLNHETAIAITETGHILTWKFIQNETTSIKISVAAGDSITCSSLCPHAPWLLALGLRNGIFLVDIRNGRIKAKIRKQRRRAFSMSWCPAAINFFPKFKPAKNIVSADDGIDATLETIEDCIRDSFKLAEEKIIDVQIKVKKVNPWVNLKHADDDEIAPEEPRKLLGESNDFLKECMALRAKIVETKDGEEEESKNEAVSVDRRKVLKARKKKKSKSHDDKQATKANEEQQSPKPIEEKQNSTPAEDKKSPQQIDEKKKLVEETETGPKHVSEELMEENQGNKTTEQSPNQADKKQNPIQIEENGAEEVNDMKPTEEKKNTEQIEEHQSPKHFEEKQSPKQSGERQSPNQAGEKQSSQLLDELKVEYPSNIVADLVESVIVETPKKGAQIKEIVEDEKVEVAKEPCKKKTTQDDETKPKTTLERVQIEQILENDYLLAVALQGGTIIVIKAADGSIESTFHVESRARRYGNSQKSLNDKWMVVSWIAPSVLLCSGAHGELYHWDFTDLSHNGSAYVPKRILVHQDHTNDLFAIASNVKILPCNESTKQHWRDRKGLKAWTIGYERSLLYTTIDKDRNTIACYPTIGHCVFSMSSSNVNPNRIALGFGDGSIRVWDLSLPHTQYIIMQFATTKHNVRIVSLAYHNTDESMLAFGTEEGKIGIINTNQVSKHPTYLAHKFNKPIYKLEWGPMDGNCDKLALYACSASIVAIYNAQKPQEDPQVFQLTSNDYITNLVWKPDLSLLAVGTKNGQIQIFTANLTLVCTLYHQVKAIQTMAWHPQATAEDEEVSPKESYLASTCSTDSTIYIYDLTNAHNDTIDHFVCKLDGHNKQIHKMVWSPHQNGMLASFSEDGRANIWNVDKREIISTFINNCADPILTGAWSGLDKNYIITAGREFTIHIWNFLEHPPKEEAELKLEKSKRLLLTNNLKMSKKVQDRNLTNVSVEKQKLKKNILTLPSVRQNMLEEAVEDCQTLLKLQQGGDIEKNHVVKLFGTNEDMQELLKEQYEQHKSGLKFSAAQQVSLWTGDISEAIKDGINSGHMTPWLISMAPMVSPKLWQKACEAYADKQLENIKSDPIEMVSYYIASHNINKAIDALCIRGLHKEALSLAKSRLPGNVEVIDDVLQKWATYCTYNGRFAVAAQNFVVLKKYDEAAKSLYKLSSINALRLALELAELSEDAELCKAVSLRYNYFKDCPEMKQNEREPIDGSIPCQETAPESSEIVINETENDIELRDEIEEVIAKTDEIKLEEDGAGKLTEKICSYDIEDKENLVLESNENVN